MMTWTQRATEAYKRDAEWKYRSYEGLRAYQHPKDPEERYLSVGVWLMNRKWRHEAKVRSAIRQHNTETWGYN